MAKRLLSKRANPDIVHVHEAMPPPMPMYPMPDPAFDDEEFEAALREAENKIDKKKLN